MYVKSIRYMEKLVAKSDNLVWDGWNVIMLFKHKNPVIHKDARFINGKWYRTRVVPLTENGWELSSARTN